MARTRRDDWLERGLAILREGGEPALTVDRLCTELGRTKGAFYHHFVDAGAYLDALLAFWEAKHTTAPIDRANAAEPARRRVTLDAAVHALDMKLDLAVRAWGARSPRARAFVARVDKRRVAYIERLYDPGVPMRLRHTLARLEYAAFLGAQQLFPDLTSPEAQGVERALYAALTALLASKRSAGPPQ